jgi:hypothetical protein
MELGLAFLALAGSIRPGLLGQWTRQRVDRANHEGSEETILPLLYIYNIIGIDTNKIIARIKFTYKILSFSKI